jgi:hypothetical protein
VASEPHKGQIHGVQIFVTSSKEPSCSIRASSGDGAGDQRLKISVVSPSPPLISVTTCKHNSRILRSVFALQITALLHTHTPHAWDFPGGLPFLHPLFFPSASEATTHSTQRLTLEAGSPSFYFWLYFFLSCEALRWLYNPSELLFHCSKRLINLFLISSF